jgi:Carboxypeptidase regulatory-like domain
MKLATQLAGLAVLLVVSSVAVSAAPASVSGVVRDSAGVPQIGAQVQLLRPNLSVVASVYTNSQGRFIISSIFPGCYSLKAMNDSFLPSLREDLHLRNGRTVVNLTLNTLYEVMQWLPAQPRAANAASDDWDWTLRSAANRPLLRWLEDGPLVVVSDGAGSAPHLKARLMATGAEGAFGESGERFSATVEDTPQNSRELLARVDFAPDSDAGMESMLGFRQDLGYAGSVQSMAEIAIEPEVEGAGERGLEQAQGLEQAMISSAETMHFGPDADIEAGSAEAFARTSNGAVAQGLPFASVTWRNGDSAVRYRMATMEQEPDTSGSSMPLVAVRGADLVMERGFHQEIAWERNTEKSGMAVVLYTDDVKNPVLEAAAHLAQPASGMGVLFDPVSGIARTAGPNYSSTGITASVEHSIPGGALFRASYASGGALVAPALPQPQEPQSEDLTSLVASARPRRVQAYTISLSGTLEGTRTRWRASYRWQPDDTVTEVAPFALDAIAPYLNLHLCQKVHQSRDGSAGIEALVEVRNLLAQGYHPYLLSDGSILIFAQDQRSLRAGLAFTF